LENLSLPFFSYQKLSFFLSVFPYSNSRGRVPDWPIQSHCLVSRYFMPNNIICWAVYGFAAFGPVQINKITKRN
jgi:hypothetical protein